jgi:rhamnosyltransferase
MPDIAPGDIAAVIVLYRPDTSALDNVRAVAEQVDHVFVVDNTETPDPAFVKTLVSLPNVTYVPLGDNMGIAAALNRGMERMRNAGYSWAITMDQDSRPRAGMVATLARCADVATESPIGLITPIHIQSTKPGRKPFVGYRAAVTAMTSGNLLSVKHWALVGGFDEGLFIDQVDNDLCLRMHRAGVAVLRCGEALIDHTLGDMTKHTGLVTNYASNHSPIRRYYIARNRFVLLRRFPDFPEFRRREKRAMLRELGKIVLYEDRKYEKLLMSWRGYLDYRCGTSGPYPG